MSSGPEPQVAASGSRAASSTSGALRGLLLGCFLVAAAWLLSGCTPPEPGGVAGTVRDPAGQPVAGVLVSVYTGASTNPISTVATTSAGAYGFTDLPGGDYRIGVTDPTHTFLDAWYASAHSHATAANVRVDGATATVDVQLTTAALLGSVGGTVRSQSAAPLAGITVALHNAAAGNAVATTTTAANGTYSFTGIDPASYKVRFSDSARVYAPQWGQGRLSVETADVVVLPASGTATMDATMAVGSSIAGRVTNGSAGLPNVYVVVKVDEDSSFYALVTTDSQGNYVVGGLAPGSYVVYFMEPAWYQNPTSGYRGEFYGTPNQADLAAATRIPIGADQQVTGIDGALAGGDCDPATYHPGADLNHADLSGKNLSNCDLTGANLTSATALGTDFRKAKLGTANLTSANLTTAVLTDATLTRANLTATTLSNAIGINTTLVGNDTAAGLLSATLVGTNFTGTGLDLTGKLVAFKNLSGANLTGANLTSTNLFVADLTGANVTGVTLTRAVLGGTKLTNAVGINSTVIGMDTAAGLLSAYLVGVDLSGTGLVLDSKTATLMDWSNANLTGASFALANVAGSKFTNANLTNVNFYATHGLYGTIVGESRTTGFLSAKFVGANLFGSDINFIGQDLTDIDFTGVNLSYVKMWDATITRTNFTNATLKYVAAYRVRGIPAALPPSWEVLNSYLFGPESDLNGAVLMNLDLRGKNLRAANLHSTRFDGSNLSGANLSGAIVGGTKFPGANLTNADLSSIQGYEGVFSGAALNGANLSDGDLRGVNLNNAVLTGANVNGLRLDQNVTTIGTRSGGLIGALGPSWVDTRLVRGYLVNSGVNLFGANLSGCDLSGIALGGVSFVGANLSGCLLRGTRLDGSNLWNATLAGADLTQADLVSTTLSGTVFHDTILQGVKSGSIVGVPNFSRQPTWRVAAGHLTGPGANLRYAHFEGVNLAGVQLSGANLDYADLTGADLTGANLDGASLYSARLTNVVGREATFRTTFFEFTWLNGADLTGADLSNARLLNVPFNGTTITGATLIGVNARGLETTTTPPVLPVGWQVYAGQLVGARAILVGAYLSGANLRDMDLTGADLTSALLEGTGLARATLTDVKLAGATMRGVSSGGIVGTPASLPVGWKLLVGHLVGAQADLTDAQLAGADLSGMDLQGATFTGATLQGTALAGSTLGGVRSGGIVGVPASLPAQWALVSGYLTGAGAMLDGAALAGADLHGQVLTNASMQSANLRGADLRGADLTNAKLSGADLTNATLTGATVAGAHLYGATLAGVTTGGLIGAPWNLTNVELLRGYLVGQGVSLVGADLSGLDLSSRRLDGVDLTGANLSGADLTSAWLRHATVAGTNFTGATLTYVNSEAVVGVPSALPAAWAVRGGYIVGPRASLSGARFTGTDLSGTDLSEAILQSAWFNGANLTGADLRAASLVNVRSEGIVGAPSALPAAWQLTAGYLLGPTAVLPAASLAGADLTGCNLTSATLTNANLAGANLTGCDLSQASMSAANLTAANLTNATVAPSSAPGAVLTGADISGAVLGGHLTGFKTGGLVGVPASAPAGWSVRGGYLVGPGTNLSGAALASVDLSGAVLTNANLSSANLSSANLTAADLTSANLSSATLTGATVTNAKFSTASLSNVSSGAVLGVPLSLPSASWLLANGYLIGPGANLAAVNLAGLDLRTTSLSGTNLSGANLTGTQLAGVPASNVSSGGIVGVPASLPSASWLLRNGYLIGPAANLRNADLSGLDLSGAVLASANLSGTNLAGTTITGSLNGVVSGSIVGVPAALPNQWRLIGGYLVGAGANLSFANLSGADLAGATLAFANLTRANFLGATGNPIGGSTATYSVTTCPDGLVTWSGQPKCVGHGFAP